MEAYPHHHRGSVSGAGGLLVPLNLLCSVLFLFLFLKDFCVVFSCPVVRVLGFGFWALSLFMCFCCVSDLVGVNYLAIRVCFVRTHTKHTQIHPLHASKTIDTPTPEVFILAQVTTLRARFSYESAKKKSDRSGDRLECVIRRFISF
jgi:hypothetical protein